MRMPWLPGRGRPSRWLASWATSYWHNDAPPSEASIPEGEVLGVLQEVGYARIALTVLHSLEQWTFQLSAVVFYFEPWLSCGQRCRQVTAATLLKSGRWEVTRPAAVTLHHENVVIAHSYATRNKMHVDPSMHFPKVHSAV